ncbi:uncharacterized protein FRV6_12739 [Fusarium oxysporum]|uniref:Uncharacterized protein n=1 Tax=Fusarium oxysporum TaxID=5507 RepID=A0A2H3TIX3_FUSOX|nr:uncharacterized protein FRV6_12739 [Fusarium oxysporum]
MEETGESSRSGANDKGSKKSASRTETTNVPKPSVDVTKTKGWASIDPNFVDPSTAVTHNNLDQLASLLQAIMGKMGDQDKKLNKLTSDVGAIKKAFGGDSGNTSRRSSMASVSHQSLVSEGSAGEISVETTPYDEVMSNLELLDGVFERFISSSEHRPLTRRTKNIQPSVDGFMEAVQQGQDQGNAVGGDIASKLQSLESKYAQDIYLTLSKRYNSHQSKGKKVATVTQSFETDIVDNAAGDGDGGSQSTEPQTPKGRKGKSVARPPKTPAARRRKKSASLFVQSDDEDDEDEAEGGAEGETPMPASTEDEDSTFQP